MKTGVHIEGGKVEREAVDAVALAVVTIFAAAQEYNMDQDTVRHALGLIGRMGIVEGATVRDTTFNG